jgi:maltose alpha-D-glucosyltransferase/alpha-amylase
MDPIYGYEAVNVESQTRDRSSLLHWMQRMLKVRKLSQAFGSGTLRFIRPGNRRILVYVRELGSDVILCVANLSSTAQPVEIDLSAYKGAVPVELVDRTAFPPVGDLPYLLTLQGYGFYWFQLSKEAQPPAWHDDRLPREDLPVFVLFNEWTSFFPDRAPQWRAPLATKLREQLESRVIPRYIASQRWSAQKDAPIERARLGDSGEWQTTRGKWLAGVFQTESGQQSNSYFIPFSIAYEDSDDVRWQKLQPAAFAKVRQQSAVGVLADATLDEGFSLSLIEGLATGAQIRTERGTVHLLPSQRYAAIRGGALPLAAIPLNPSSRNTHVRVGDAFFVKYYRQLHSGINSEVEIGRYLTEVVPFPNIAPIAGAAEYRNDDGTTVTLAIVQAFVTNQGDGWDYTVGYLNRFLQDYRTSVPGVENVHGAYLQLVKTLATRTAELHLALASPTDNIDFSPESLSEADLGRWRTKIGEEAQTTLALLREARGNLPGDASVGAEALLLRGQALLERIGSCVPGLPRGRKIRCHGDYHLGQVLLKRNDFVIVDFAGEPGRTLVERREKRSPLRDVATMLRSFSYARQAALIKSAPQSDDEARIQRSLLDEWEQQSRQTFLTTYHSVAASAGLFESWDESQALLPLFELDKALYEVRYELGNRPEWTAIALRSLGALIQ